MSGNTGSEKRFREQHIDKYLSAFSVNSRDELYAQIAEDLVKSGEVFDRLHPDLARSSLRISQPDS